MRVLLEPLTNRYTTPVKAPTLESLHCVHCQGPLERAGPLGGQAPRGAVLPKTVLLCPRQRALAQWGDPVLWCAACQRGWLPGTRGFDKFLERQGEGPDPQPDLWD